MDVLQGDNRSNPASPTVVARKVGVLSTVRFMSASYACVREVLRSHAENVFRMDGRGPQQCEQRIKPHRESADRRIAPCMEAAVCLMRLQRAEAPT
jgi:hypothetical protein